MLERRSEIARRSQAETGQTAVDINCSNILVIGRDGQLGLTSSAGQKAETAEAVMEDSTVAALQTDKGLEI